MCQFKEALIFSSNIFTDNSSIYQNFTNDTCPSLAQTTIPTSSFDLALRELFRRWVKYAGFLNEGIETSGTAVLPGLSDWKARKNAFTQTQSMALRLMEPTFFGLAEGLSSLAPFWL